MYFFEQKAILPITDDILRQTGGIEGLRERIQSVDGMYLSIDEDKIVMPIFSERRYSYDSYEGKNKLHNTVNDIAIRQKGVLSSLDELKIEYNPDDLEFVSKKVCE